MHVRRLAASGILLATCGLVTGVASPAAAVCDSYSGGCATPAPTTDATDGGEITDESEGAASGDGGSNVSNGRSLPVTGGELVLLTAVGAGALAGGAAMVVAGRRTSQPST